MAPRRRYDWPRRFSVKTLGRYQTRCAGCQPGERDASVLLDRQAVSCLSTDHEASSSHGVRPSRLHRERSRDAGPRRSLHLVPLPATTALMPIEEVRPAWSASAGRCSTAPSSRNSRSTSSACCATCRARSAT